MQRRSLILSGLSAAGLAGCASMGGPQCSTIGLCTYVKWNPYTGRLQHKVFKGKFGTPTDVEGIAFYENWGAPDRPFRIIGTISTSSNLNDYTADKKRHDVAEEAKEHGADAVAHVVSSGHVEDVTAIVTGTVYGMVFNDDIFIALQYVDPKDVTTEPQPMNSMKDVLGQPATEILEK